MTVDIATLTAKAETPGSAQAASAVDSLGSASAAAQAALTGLTDAARKLQGVLSLLGTMQVAKSVTAVPAPDKAAQAVQEKKMADATAKPKAASDAKSLSSILPSRVEVDASWKKIQEAANKQLNANLDKLGEVFSKGAEDLLKNGKAGWQTTWKTFTESLGSTFKSAVAEQRSAFVKSVEDQAKALFKSVLDKGKAWIKDTGTQLFDEYIKTPFKSLFSADAKAPAAAVPEALAATLDGNGIYDTISKGVSSIGDAIGSGFKSFLGLFGGSGGSGGAGESPAAGNSAGPGMIASLLQKGKGIYDVFSKGISGFGESISGGAQSFMSMFGGGASAASGAANAAGTVPGAIPGALSGSLGAVAGIAAGVAGGVMGGRLIAGEYGSNKVVNAGTAIGAVVGSVIPGIGTAIGALVGGLLGGVANRAFGMGEKKVTSQGISGALSAGGFSGETYANWQQKGGWFRSDKSGTDRSAVDAATAQALGDGYKTLLTASGDLAKALGVDTTAFATRSQTLDIVLKDNDAAGNQKAISDFFVGVGDAMANELVPGLAQLSLQGESAGTTLQRIAGNFPLVDAVLATLGKTSQQAFGEVGLASVAAREQLVAAAGGIDALTSGTAFFAQNFLSEAEQMAPIVGNVKAQLAAMGQSGVTTNEQFKALVMGLDLSSEAGARQYAQLLLLAPQFKQMTDYTIGATAAAKSASEVFAERSSLQQEFDQLTMTSVQLLKQQRDGIDAGNQALFDGVQAAKAAQTAREALASAYDRESNALQATIDSMTSFASGLRGFRDALALGAMSPLSPEQKYAEAQAQYERTLAAAQNGDAAAQGNYQQAANAFLAASQTVNASDGTYLSDYQHVLQATGDTIKWAEAQADAGKASLAALEKQVTGLIDINTSVLGVSAAIKALAAALAGVDAVTGGASGAAAAAMARQAPGTIDYASMGTPAMQPLVDEIRALRTANEALAGELKGLRVDQQQQTGAIIGSNDAAHQRSASQMVAGSAAASENALWAQQSKAAIS